MSQFFQHITPLSRNIHSASAASNTKLDKTSMHSLRASIKHSLLFLFALFLFLTIWRMLQSPPDFLLTEEQRFVRFTETVFRNEMTGNTLNLHYTVANPDNYQISSNVISLGDFSPNAFQKSYAILENYYDTLSSFEHSKLSAKRQLTYDIFKYYLETELSGAEYMLYDEPLSPTLGVQAQLPILLAEYTFRTKNDIEDYLCLLTQIPDYFDSILSFEREKAKSRLFMSNECADEVILQCQQFITDTENNYLITVFNDKIDEISNLSLDEKIAFKNRNQSVFLGYVVPAYQTLIAGLNDLEGSGQNDAGLYYLPLGQQYYQHRVRSVTGDSRSIEEIEDAVKNRMINDFSAIQELMQTDSTAPQSETNAACDTDETDSLTQSASSLTTSSPLAMLEDLRQKSTQDFPLLPTVSCEIKYVHESLQNYLSPAFYLTPAIDSYDENVIYINPSSNYKALELYTTLAHEGYPGHLYQSVYFTSSDPDLLRCILDIGGYTEGWATYVEIEYAHNFWDSASIESSLSRYNRSFTLGLASLLDIGIHYHGYTLNDAANFLIQLGFQEETARSLYNSILQSPANYLQYYIGYLNFCELRSEQQEMQKTNFSLKEFHKTVLETGPVPFSLLRQQLKKDLE